jgi:hypothetical protein
MDSGPGAEALPPARCRIRTSPDQRRLAAPRGLSQPTTSFIGSWRQGIPRAPFVAPRPLPRGRATRRILRSTHTLYLLRSRTHAPSAEAEDGSSVPASAPPGGGRADAPTDQRSPVQLLKVRRKGLGAGDQKAGRASRRPAHRLGLGSLIRDFSRPAARYGEPSRLAPRGAPDHCTRSRGQ